MTYHRRTHRPLRNIVKPPSRGDTRREQSLKMEPLTNRIRLAYPHRKFIVELRLRGDTEVMDKQPLRMGSYRFPRGHAHRQPEDSFQRALV
jgi:hypothetical protein